MADTTAKPSLPEQGVVPHYHDPIRIVPLHVPEELTRNLPHAGIAATPQLTYRGGPLMARVKVFTVFWGSAWVNAQASLAKQINGFFTAIVTSSLIDQLGEYSVPQYTIGHGSLIGTTNITTPAPPKSITDTAIRTLLQHNVAANSAFPQPDVNTLYFVYTPPGSAVVQGGSRSCQAFCGYHDAIGGQLFYAAMPYPNCQGCTGGLSVEDALTSTSSHELCEAITDAVPGQGWYDDMNGEIGDICAWKTKKVGQWTVQLEWSNKQGKCV
ncbi:MAG: hemagglutinin protein [Bryobacterales bacterium]|nr:hemagglutinin protein [Bryobacterales bacterium]